ncbi:hypothetical protein ES705_13372 [subsurface metagenome]
MQIKKLIKKVSNELYKAYREKPHSFIDTQSFFENFNTKIITEEDINENDFIIALDYLKERNYVKLMYSIGSNMPPMIQVKPQIIDFVE